MESISGNNKSPNDRFLQKVCVLYCSHVFQVISAQFATPVVQQVRCLTYALARLLCGHSMLCHQK